MNFSVRGYLIAFLLITALPLVFAQDNGSVLVPLDALTNQSVGASVVRPATTHDRALEQAALNQNCVQTWECRQFAPGQHFYGCTYDTSVRDCRCYTGPIDRCQNNDLRCAFEFECQASTTASGYNYDCTYDKAEQECRCFTGTFDRCRLEVSDPAKVVPPQTEPPTPPIETPLEPEPAREPIAEANPSLLPLIGAVVVAAIIVLIIVALRRETPEKHLAAARNLHKRAEEAHERGSEDEAKEFMKEADRHRRRAFALTKRKQ